jgi:predicted Ser/Thr protein kinase
VTKAASGNPAGGPAASLNPQAASIESELEQLSASVRTRFLAEKRVLSFDEYLAELLQHPFRHTRDAARYLRDCMDFYGTTTVERPWGPVRRFTLFDQELAGVDGDTNERSGIRARLVGNEDLQNAFYRALSNFVREGRANRLVLLHGPNGSAKSTFAACLMRALEHYSSTMDGALYRFSWVFSRNAEERSIGFSSASAAGRGALESFAHVDSDRISAKLGSELREHPLLLLPLAERRALLTRAYASHNLTEPPPDWLWNGQLGRKNAAVLDALLASFGGDLRRVLAHVQVERYYVSRRYRTGAVTIGPQMSVDAGERQITADRTLHELPAALSAVTLYETHGELVDGQGGVIEYSDLLKRPLDAWKYLLLAIEDGEVALNMSMLTVNAVLVASTNEQHLDAFRQHPEYNSFRARLLPLRVGYMLDYKREQEIYDTQIIPHLRQHVAPHATKVAALWSVLTRLLPSKVEHYDDPTLGKIAADLTPMEKARIYADGSVPQRLDADRSKLLRAGLAEIAHEFDTLAVYEGKTGASPREVRTLLLDAAQHPVHRCLSPLGVIDMIKLLCEHADYEFLQHKPDNGYHAHRDFLKQVRDAWLDELDAEVRNSTGLVEESQYRELFDKYVTHVSLWVKGERYRDPITGEAIDPDQTLLKRVEKILDARAPEEFRRNLISMIAAFAIDHPGAPIDNSLIFGRYLERMRSAYFEEHRGQIAGMIRDMIAALADDSVRADAAARGVDETTALPVPAALPLVNGSAEIPRPRHTRSDPPQAAGLDPEALAQARAALARLKTNGYCELCARASLGELLEERYA